MNEIDVVVEVRQSPDSGELIVVKQKYLATGDIRPAGSPVETRIELMARKARLSPFTFADLRMGLVPVAVKVENVGVVAFSLDRVALVFEYEEPQQAWIKPGLPAHSRGGSIDLFPRVPDEIALLQPGETRDYLLPPQFSAEVAALCAALTPSRFWIAAYSSQQEVGRVGGQYLQPFFGDVRVHSTCEGGLLSARSGTATGKARRGAFRLSATGHE